MTSVHIDGASRGNPGNAGIGIHAVKEGKVLLNIGEYIGKTTNNVAEYSALIRALEALLILGIKKAKFFSDSQLLVEQLKGNFRVKDEKLKILFEQARALISKMDDFKIEHIRREKNKAADALANKGIDSRTL